MSVSICRLDERNLSVKFNYDVEKIKKIRTLSSYKWDKEKRQWLVPYTDLNLLKELFADEKLYIENNLNPNSNKTKTSNYLKLMENGLKLKG